MKKLLPIAFFLLLPGKLFAADPTAIPITDQLQLALLSHVTAVAEQTTHGQVKMEFLDSVVQFGHYKGDYIFALDGGASNSLAPDAEGKVAATLGGHIHVISALAANLNINPTLKSELQLLELNPRYSYDFDVHHGVLGITFGAKIPF